MIDEKKQDTLQQLLNNERLMSVLKQVFWDITEQSKPTIDRTNDDSVLGQKYRAYMFAKELLATAFVELESYKRPQKEEEQFNKAK